MFIIYYKFFFLIKIKTEQLKCILIHLMFNKQLKSNATPRVQRRISYSFR